jgi:hypothetical protein
MAVDRQRGPARLERPASRPVCPWLCLVSLGIFLEGGANTAGRRTRPTRRPGAVAMLRSPLRVQMHFYGLAGFSVLTALFSVLTQTLILRNPDTK